MKYNGNATKLQDPLSENATETTTLRLKKQDDTGYVIQSVPNKNRDDHCIDVTGIAHDINNMISIIRGYLDIIETHSAPESTEYVYLQRALSASKILTDLNRLLLPGQKEYQLCRDIQTIYYIISEIGEVLTGEKNNIYFHVTIAPDTHDFKIPKLHLKRIMQNLIQNAKEAMPSGGTIRIRIKNAFLKQGKRSPIKPGRYVQITIKDEGIGISKDQPENIFRLGYSTKKNGQGLGLRTTQHLVNLNGGFIEVTSQVGRGTSFNLFFPWATQKFKQRTMM